MSEPKIAALKPEVLTLEPGTYYWCACGASANQPFCDGSHKGSGLAPHEVRNHRDQQGRPLQLQALRHQAVLRRHPQGP